LEAKCRNLPLGVTVALEMPVALVLKALPLSFVDEKIANTGLKENQD
jgi:hypothetical protein